MELTSANDDLLIEILLRLPAKSLIRFKSVSKKWLSLISCDYLCHQHTLRCPKLQQSLILHTNIPPLVYFNPSSDGGRVVAKPYSLSVPNHRILQACNGLMLLGSEQLRDSYYVYNPTTRRSRKITLTNTNTHKYPHVATINLAFDPSNSPYYKIVCLRSTIDTFGGVPFVAHPDTEQYTFQIEVYDSESHTWKLSVEPFIHDGYTFFHSFEVQYWNNAIYWCTGEDYCFFDIAKGEMKSLPYPQSPLSYQDYQGDIASCQRLQELNGHLFHYELIYELIYEGVRATVSLWELQGDRWLLNHDQEAIRHVDILRLMGGEGTCNLLVHHFMDRAGEIESYSFFDKSYEKLLDITEEPFDQTDDGFPLVAIPFGEVLALV